MNGNMRKLILTRLEAISATSKIKSVYTVEFNGVRLCFNSGKSSWSNKGAAKNALRNALYSLGNNAKEKLSLLKELEDEGIITYKELT